MASRVVFTCLFVALLLFSFGIVHAEGRQLLGLVQDDGNCLKCIVAHSKINEIGTDGNTMADVKDAGSKTPGDSLGAGHSGHN